ncbi:MAG TPA: hydroxyacylglutathione hydrolase [Devosiaceae bacterium]|nr:hydroxyacylglutathione hydrolase [Devosiaceae bacterium]
MSLLIEIFICRDDNYGYLVHDVETKKTAAIDAPDAKAIRAALDRRGWKLSDIFITHHHTDHVEGIPALKRAFGAKVTGPDAEAEKILGLDVTVGPGENVVLGATSFYVIGTPGHTLGHIVYYDHAGGHLFSADALFSLGVGRMFEGKPGPMWEGLEELRELPDDTLVYCGHEYTLDSARFAQSVDPRNAALNIRAAEVKRMREAGQFTVPVSLGLEKRTNPFLRADQPVLAKAMGLPEDADPVAVFAALRSAKDNFK